MNRECATQPKKSRPRVEGAALSIPSGTGWHLEAMTTSEPEPAAEPSITAGNHSTADDAATTTNRQSRWSKLNRTNRVAALVLGGVATVFVAVLIFGAGVLVGAEFGGAEGHHHGSETSDYGTDGQDSGEHEGGGSEGNGDRGGDGQSEGNGDRGGDGQSEGNGDRGGDGTEGNRDQGETDQQPSPKTPPPAPTATPRP
ncbi:MAG: hypothetical protein QOK18_467 [Mycobacterium sp.]|nr:hypothetical protein [Mycobacterium sp.]